jgi:hypothetical protein
MLDKAAYYAYVPEHQVQVISTEEKEPHVFVDFAHHACLFHEVKDNVCVFWISVWR